jgi:hypothetical protein
VDSFEAADWSVGDEVQFTVPVDGVVEAWNLLDRPDELR